METNSTNKCSCPCESCFVFHHCGSKDCHLMSQIKCPHGVWGRGCSVCFNENERFDHPVTQSKEWRNIESVAMNIFYQLDDDSGASVDFRQANNDKRIDFVMQLICKTLRTELESLLQEIGYITAKPIGAGRPLTKENQAYNLALSTMREVISKRIQQYGGQ